MRSSRCVALISCHVDSLICFFLITLNYHCMFTFRCSSGRSEGQASADLCAPRTVVGRAPASDFVVPNPTVSNKHCVITRAEDGLISVQDLRQAHPRGQHVTAPLTSPPLSPSNHSLLMLFQFNCVLRTSSHSPLSPCSSNGTFVSDVLVGKAKSATLANGCELCLSKMPGQGRA